MAVFCECGASVAGIPVDRLKQPGHRFPVCRIDFGPPYFEQQHDARIGPIIFIR